MKPYFASKMRQLFVGDLLFAEFVFTTKVANSFSTTNSSKIDGNNGYSNFS